MGEALGGDREVRPRRFRKDALERDDGRKAVMLPTGKETSRSRGPAVLGDSGNGVGRSWLFTSRKRWRQPCLMRVGEAGASRSGFGSERSSRGGIETQGRNGSSWSGNVLRGFGTHRRSKASRPSATRRTNRDLRLATADGAGEFETHRRPGEGAAQAASGSGVSLGIGRAVPLSRDRSAQPLRRQEHPVGFLARGVAQAMALGGGGCGSPGNWAGASPSETWSCRWPAIAGAVESGKRWWLRASGASSVEPKPPGGLGPRERTGPLFGLSYPSRPGGQDRSATARGQWFAVTRAGC